MDFHPAAQLFPLMEGEEYERLKEDIAKYGVDEPIAVWRGVGLDGRNRAKACSELNIDPPVKHLPEDTDPLAYVIRKNIRRRHLNVKERCSLAEAVLKLAPDRSSRQVAEDVGLSHHTVEKVRQGMEDVGAVPTSEQRTDARGRKQPARKKRTRPPKEKPAPDQAAAPAPGAGRTRLSGSMQVAELVDPGSPDAPPAEPDPEPEPPVPPRGSGEVSRTFSGSFEKVEAEPVLFPDPPPSPPPPAVLGDPGPAHLKKSEHERVKELADDEEDEQLGLFLQSLMDRAAKVERVRCARLAEQYAGRFLEAHMPLKALAKDILALGGGA